MDFFVCLNMKDTPIKKITFVASNTSNFKTHNCSMVS